ncbi:uncharacterized protein LOC144647498 [Oculina patagonica]
MYAYQKIEGARWDNELKDLGYKSIPANSWPNKSKLPFPLVDSQGKILLPPAYLREGCSAPVYANPRQALRILKRREVKRRLVLSGRLKIGRQEKRKTENEVKVERDEETSDRIETFGLP